ncbi:MAG: hypothetical protein IKE21_06880 [Erysipelotrichaceae bacterium]|nr:hypothetical protein [Erysipelotrichaceae bacterium]
MKKLFLIALTILLLAGCQNTNTSSTVNVKPEGNGSSDTPAATAETQQPEEMVGAWEVSKHFSTVLDDTEERVFANVAKELPDYTPVRVLGTKDGTDYAYLAARENGDDFRFCLAVLSQKGGNTEIVAIHELDPADIATTAEYSKDLLEGWEIASSGKPGALSEEGEAALQKAMEGFTGVHLLPVAQLGTQLVEGTNYAFLCFGNPTDDADDHRLYLTVVYEDLEGNCTVRDNLLIDLPAYAVAGK